MNNNSNKQKIYLDNRDKELNYLLRESDNSYSFHYENNEEGHYSRIGYNKDDSINFFDPSGGPFMQVGGILPGTGRKIISIVNKNNTYIFNVK